MKKHYHYFIAVFTILILSSQMNNVNAQLNNYAYKLGLQGHYVDPANEYTNDWGFLARAFIRFELSRYFDIEGGAGYGYITGEDYIANDYATRFFPLDARILFSPIVDKSWNPYLFVGIGAMPYWLADSPASPARPPEDALDGFVGLVNAGLGTEIALSDSWLLDISATFNIVDSDWMNGNASQIGDNPLNQYDRYYSVGLGLAYIGEGCDSDRDNDGLGRCEEEKLGTDPNKADSDGDGLSDGDEVHKYKTDPLKADTDGDGLSDGDELLKHKTNPLKADSDGDGLNDYDEIMVYKTDPLKADTDGDGLSDGDEVLKYKTDPNKVDTDGDGLNDGDEVLKYKTNPLKVDTDGDGLSDGDEVLKHKTNPLNADTDGGSVDDGREVLRGTDPLDPSDDVVKPAPVFKPILFAFNSSKIDKVGEKILAEAITYLNENPDVDLLITGHTDNVGSKKVNQTLSERRADTVKKYLAEKGIDAKRISTKGFAFDKPAASNDTDKGRTLDRKSVV